MVDFPGRTDNLLSRRALLRGGALGVAGLSVAALVGCGDDDDDDAVATATQGPAAATATPAATAAATEAPAATPAATATPAAAATEAPREEFLNAELLKLNDPDAPLPYVAPEPNLTPKAGGVIRITFPNPIGANDPTKASNGGTIGVLGAVMDRLLEFEGNAQLHPFKVPDRLPGLAQTWEISPDGLTLTFNVAENAKFHNVPPVNGRDFTAEDVRWAYNRYATEGLHRSKFDNTASMDTPDTHTFRMQLNAPQPDLSVNMGAREMPIYPRELVDGAQNLLEEHVLIGTGPMISDSFTEDLTLFTYVKNAEYWKQDVLLDGMELHVVRDGAARLAGYRAGQYDAGGFATILPQAQALLASNPDTQLHYTPPANSLWAMAPNISNPKWDDARLRQAMMLAIDHQKIVDTVHHGLSSVLPVMPWIHVFDDPPGEAELGPWFKYDPEQASQLLSAAGFADGFEFALSHAYDFIDPTLAIVYDGFRDVGITVNIEKHDYAAFQAVYIGREFEESAAGYWVGGYDADNFFKVHLATGSSGNLGRVSDPQLDEWAVQQSHELDPDARREILRRIWDRYLDQAYRIPLTSEGTISTYAPHVRNYRVGAPLVSITVSGNEGTHIAPVWLDT
ncbi:MAG: ABC transporter substrate-binding protein [Chloroflexi bacterium]|nr:ABC transporter substrate-binding protein [Chloroflexota bacterium]